MQNSNPNPKSWQVLVLLLKEIAKQKGITQEEIAQLSGITQTNISRIFSLRYKPRLDTFLSVAGAIKVNFFVEDKDGISDLNKAMESAMEQLGRRPDKLNEN